MSPSFNTSSTSSSLMLYLMDVFSLMNFKLCKQFNALSSHKLFTLDTSEPSLPAQSTKSVSHTFQSSLSNVCYITTAEMSLQSDSQSEYRLHPLGTINDSNIIVTPTSCCDFTVCTTFSILNRHCPPKVSAASSDMCKSTFLFVFFK